MGKTSDLFKKIRDTKGTFHAKIGISKDRNGMDLYSWRVKNLFCFCVKGRSVQVAIGSIDPTK